MARPSRENLVRYAQETNEDYLFGFDNVIGVGTGLRERNDELTNEVCVQVFVERKLPVDRLAPSQVIPGRVRGFEGANVRTDIIAAAIPEAQQDTTRYRPVPGGCSIGPERSVSAGTLGGWACDNTDDTIVMLSNNHVISNLDTMPVLRRIVQPGRLDGGVLPGDVIGRLKRDQPVNTVANPPTVPIPTSVVDAAIGSINDDIDIDHDVLGIGPAIYELRAPAVNMNVQKRGRTTRLTNNGRITTVGGTFRCTYRNRTRISRIRNAFRISSTDGNVFSAAGDSGSLIFDQAVGQLNGTLPVVGLLYAGGTFNNGTPFTDAVDINSVFGALNLSTVCTCVARALIRAIFGADSAETAAGGGARATERNLRKLRQRLDESDLGAAIDEMVTREAATAGKILATDERAFEEAVAVLMPLKDRLTGPKVLETPIDDDLVECVAQLGKTFARYDRGLGRGMTVIQGALKELRGESIGQILDMAKPQKSGKKK